MSLRRSAAATLVTLAMMLGTTVPAFALPALDAGVTGVPTPVVLTSAGPSTSHEGLGTLVVVLLATGALLAGAAAGFGGARVSARRSPLHPH